jgi:hypothetical protein
MRALLKRIEDYMSQNEVKSISDLPADIQSDINAQVDDIIVASGLDSVLTFLRQF